MSTLTLQVRLGISRGWRVRTLNNVKFYNQAIAHCLFIFSSLRARGYKDRIWTMNYTVFASGSKYSIYVEYFLLPDHSSWKRGIQQYFCSAYMLNRSVIGGQVRPGFGFSLVFKGTPHLRRVANVRRSSRKQSARATNNAIWAWASRARLLDVMHRTFLLDNDYNLSFETMESWAAGLAGKLADTGITNPVTPHRYTNAYSKISKTGWQQFMGRFPFADKWAVRSFLRARRRSHIHFFSHNIHRGAQRINARVIRRLGRNKERLGLNFRTRQRIIEKARQRVMRFLMVCSARRLLWSQTSWSGAGKVAQWSRVTSAYASEIVANSRNIKARSKPKQRRNTRRGGQRSA